MNYIYKNVYIMYIYILCIYILVTYILKKNALVLQNKNILSKKGMYLRDDRGSATLVEN